jgi:hypothetical protein
LRAVLPEFMMKHSVRKWSTFTLRWGIAVVGIWWVLSKTPFHDELMYINGNGELSRAQVLGQPPEASGQFQIVDTLTGTTRSIDRQEVWTKAGEKSVRVKQGDKWQKVKVLAIRPGAHLADNGAPAELLITDPVTDKPVKIAPDQVRGGYKVRVAYPLVDIGVVRLVKQARLSYLLLALAVLPFSYLITSRRWHLLLKAMDIHLTQARSFVLNMVGCFYNSFMPGSTGGDLIKAYYAAKHTTHKVRAVLSVIVDRIVGLLALIVVGGIMATTQLQVPECRTVALVCAGLSLATIVGLVVFYHPAWRKATGLDWLMKRLPLQKHVHHAVEAMELYGKRPAAPIWGGIMTFPVHLTTIASAILAGKAFGLTMPLLYYFTVVPVIVLVSAIPISPQGAGVMEFFAVQLTQHQGVTVSQAIALAMALRFGQMFWNLVAGLFVLRGGYHAPTEKEQEALETDEEDDTAANAVAVERNSGIRNSKSESNPNDEIPMPNKSAQPV